MLDERVGDTVGEGDGVDERVADEVAVALDVTVVDCVRDVVTVTVGEGDVLREDVEVAVEEGVAEAVAEAVAEQGSWVLPVMRSVSK